MGRTTNRVQNQQGTKPSEHTTIRTQSSGHNHQDTEPSGNTTNRNAQPSGPPTKPEYISIPCFTFTDF
jgi:hypothetical protein